VLINVQIVLYFNNNKRKDLYGELVLEFEVSAVLWRGITALVILGRIVNLKV